MNGRGRPYDAIVLTGGRGSRLGGADKPSLEVGGRTLADRVAAAVAGAERLVVVGPSHGLPAAIVTREEPAGGGPVAAIAAGVVHVTAPEVVVLAADLPFVTPAAVESLRAALAADPAAAVAVPVDAEGRDQFLAAAWRMSALRAAVEAVGEPGGVAVRRLFEGIVVARVDGVGLTWFDVDTAADLARAQAAVENGGHGRVGGSGEP